MFSSFANPTSLNTSTTPAIDPRKREIFMCVSALRGPLEKSFEEERIEDYLKSYASTNNPPRPVPQEPTDPAARLALGLPPLFQPHVEVLTLPDDASSVSSSITLTGPGSGIVGSMAHVRQPPDLQMFDWVRGDGEKVRYMSISCLYTFFSHEELRCHAYSKGIIYPPPGSVPVPAPIIASNADPLASSSSSSENFQSISCKPEYDKHSFEELRFSYLTTGRALTSNEIFQVSKPASIFSGTPSFGFSSMSTTNGFMSAGPNMGGGGGGSIFGRSTLDPL